jgi:putative PIG3 family NAD(P)H quinone oxidoreductase
MSDLPATMQAVEIAGFGGPDVLTLTTRPIPRRGAGEVLIRVAAAGVNRPDIVQRQGAYPPPPGASDLPGLEVAGRIAAIGPGVEGFQLGDPVCALLSGGGYAEYAAVPAVQVLPVPACLSLIEAASLPETCFTVWSNLFDRAHCAAGEIVLIHGGTSGIGVTAIQMAKSFGATVFATAGSAAKVQECERLGAVRGIDYKTEDFVAVIKEATGGRGANIILDMVGGDYVARNIQAAATDGRIVSIAFLRGNRAEIDLGRIMFKRLILTGSTLRSRPPAEKGAIAAALKAEIWPRIERSEIKPVLYRQFPLADAAAAHRLMESSEHIGKIMLTVADLA